MAVMEFKFDESFDGRFMSVGGWIGEESEWKKLETSWKNLIDKLNFKNKPNQQITRFHGTDLNGFYREYKHWDKDMSAKFSTKLIGFINRRKMAAFTIGADMDALEVAFPKNSAEREESAYALCIKTVMVEIAHVMREFRLGDTVHLSHAHGNWDHAALRGYNSMVNDQRWENRELFEGITPLTKDNSVELQAADLIAFEAHKALKDKMLRNVERLRKPVQAMYDKRIPLGGKHIDLSAAMALKQVMEESGKYAL